MNAAPTFRPNAAHTSYGATTSTVASEVLPRKTSQKTPRNVLTGIGAVLLLMLCVVPVWNALLLLQDPNYVFWAGQWSPRLIILLSVVVFVLYIASLWIFFSYSPLEAQSEQTIMMIATIFITLLGLGFMLVSLPLCRQARHTYTNLMHRCDYSLETHRLYEVSQVLQNIRRTPGCIDKYSVEECRGYQEVLPYSQYLKTMENSFRCSGFCFSRPAAGAVPAEAAPDDEEKAAVHLAGEPVLGSGDAAAGSAGAAAEPAGAGGSTTLLGSSGAAADATAATAAPREPGGVERHHEDHVIAFGLMQLGDAYNATGGGPAGVLGLVANYPPTLFSDANYQASCEGMAARSMINFAGDVGFQTFYQGIYLVLISISMGVLKLLGYCSRKGDSKDDEIRFKRSA